MKKIDEKTLSILSKVTVEDNKIFLTCGQLDRKQYLAVNDILVSMGGKWNRKAKAHIFNSDPTEKLESVLLTGEIERPQDYGFFETPEHLIERMIDVAEIKPYHIILEPSAGKGAIAAYIKNQLGNDCTTIELLENNCKYLKEIGLNPIQGDFLETLPERLQYDRIVANPPFSYKGHPQADIDHVLHMWKCLKPGGRIVSIMGAGMSFRENKKSVEFRGLVSRYGYFEKLPEGTFKESGTMVNTVIVVLDKP